MVGLSHGLSLLTNVVVAMALVEASKRQNFRFRMIGILKMFLRILKWQATEKARNAKKGKKSKNR